MKIYGDINERCFDPSLEPLFQAMLAGQTIASITIMRGTMNKNDPSKDITLEQVVASEYTQGVSSSLNRESGQYESNDYVEAAPRNFYMNWVRSFVI